MSDENKEYKKIDPSKLTPSDRIDLMRNIIDQPRTSHPGSHKHYEDLFALIIDELEEIKERILT